MCTTAILMATWNLMLVVASVAFATDVVAVAKDKKIEIRLKFHIF